MEVFYVSALLLPNEPMYRSLDTYFSTFQRLAGTGIQIGIYLDKRLETVENNFPPNVRILDYVSVEKETDGPVELPTQRNHQKDTADYLWIQLMKLRLMARAAKDTRISQKVLAWIDFGIMHMMRDVSERLATYRFPESCAKIRAPGCWTPSTYNIWDAIVWRYCGSLLVGRKELFVPAFEKQQALVRAGLPRLTWEVNYWSQMDNFEWYKANHDDSMIVNL